MVEVVRFLEKNSKAGFRIDDSKSDWLRAPSYQNENPSKRYKLNKKTVYSTTVHAFQTLDDNCDMTLRPGSVINYDSYSLIHVSGRMSYTTHLI